MIEHSESLTEIATALAKAQAEIKGAIKDSTNPHFDSSYADLASVWEACRGPLTSHGLSVVQAPGYEADTITVTTMLLHASGQWIRSTAATKPRDLSPQSVGSATTYLRRYGLAATVGVAPEDDDGNAAQGNGEPARPAKRQKSGRQPGEAPQEYEARKPGAIDTTAVFFKFGSASGMSVKDTPTPELVKYQKTLERNVIDPEKKRWKKDNEALLAAVVSELDNRQQRDDTPFDHEPPPTPTPRAPETAEAPILGDPAVIEQERKALLAKVTKLANAIKLSLDERRTIWNTYMGTATQENCDPAALQDLVAFLTTRAGQKGVDAA